MKRKFKMNGKVYQSMMEIAKDLGVKRVYPRDFAKYNIEEMTDGQTIETTAEQTEAETSTKKEDKVEPEKKVDKKTTEQPKVEKKVETAEKEVKAVDEEKVDKRYTRRLGTPEQIKETQDKVPNMTIVEFNNDIKHFAIDALVQMAEAVDVKTWDTVENEPIRRMRLLMELKNYYYPNEKIPVKPSSDWKNIDTDDLVKLAKSKKINYKKSDNPKIQRMWLVQSLKVAGLTPKDVTKKVEKKVDKDKVKANA